MCNCMYMLKKMGNFIVLFLLFVVFIPGVFITLTAGYKNRMAPIFIHGFLFALVYCILSHVYWHHIHNMHRQERNTTSNLVIEMIPLNSLN